MTLTEDTTTAVHAFLVNRAGLNRVTNHEEIQKVAGQLLFGSGRIPLPFLSREDVIEALKRVDDISVALANVQLSALVVHFWDDGITQRFFDSAVERGLVKADDIEDAAARKQFHQKQIAKIFGGLDVVDVPNDLSELFPAPENDEEDAEVGGPF